MSPKPKGTRGENSGIQGVTQLKVFPVDRIWGAGNPPAQVRMLSYQVALAP